ncbi:hypothetical protein EDC01DRAFT_648830 [Geopyxis carbonaria]|nr:hypothetical protein EDC01DRAFT_648830 [Geopyxis carbonaria]
MNLLPYVTGLAPSSSKEEPPITNMQRKRLLVASPYTDIPHLLDLDTLELPYQFMARALTVMRPVTEAYSTTPYIDAFNWHEVLSELQRIIVNEQYVFPETSYYVIVFRSQIPPTTDRSHLGDLDAAAHIEAVKGGGLLKYWFGTPNGDYRNLATCLWRNREDAKIGGAGPDHARAMREVRELYLEWRVERLRLVIDENAKGFQIIKWVD